MKGKYRIHIQTKKLIYDFEIKRNLTIIQGDSATGKTTLVDLIRLYSENGENSPVQLHCSVPCEVLEGKAWQSILATYHNCIVFIDEGNAFITSEDFARAIQKSDNYFVLITREELPMLPYSVDEIYGIRTSGKYNSLTPTHQEFYQLYGRDSASANFEKLPDVIVTEDSNSGYEFFKDFCEDHGIECISANGKSNILGILNSLNDKKVIVIADGAAIGAEMSRLSQLSAEHSDILLYLPESFEWLLLKAELLDDRKIPEILQKPYEYIDSMKYISWERFFTELLVNETANTYLAYRKSQLNSAYLNDKIKHRIYAQIIFISS